MPFDSIYLDVFTRIIDDAPVHIQDQDTQHEWLSESPWHSKINSDRVHNSVAINVCSPDDTHCGMSDDETKLDSRFDVLIDNDEKTVNNNMFYLNPQLITIFISQLLSLMTQIALVQWIVMTYLPCIILTQNHHQNLHQNLHHFIPLTQPSNQLDKHWKI